MLGVTAKRTFVANMSCAMTNAHVVTAGGRGASGRGCLGVPGFRGEIVRNLDFYITLIRPTHD
jgi:peptide deformylase